MDSLNLRQRILLNQPHIESVSGDIANFTTDMKAPLKECKIYFEPIQEGEGDPSPDNVRLISGWTGVQLTQANENLIPESLPDNVITGAASGGKIAGASNAKIFAIPIPKNTPLHIQKISGDNSAGNIGLLENGEPQVGDSWNNGKGLTNAINQNYSVNEYSWMGVQSYDLKEAEKWFTTRELMVSVGNTRKEYVAPKGYSTRYISWADEVGIVFGGSLDVLTGVLTVEKFLLTLDGTVGFWQLGGGVPYWRVNPVYAEKPNFSKRSETISNKYSTITGESTTDKAIRITKDNNGIYVYDSDFVDSETAVSIMQADPIQIVYPLLNPIEYQLTPQQLLTLKGTNNIWSNSNGQTEVKFWTH